MNGQAQRDQQRAMPDRIDVRGVMLGALAVLAGIVVAMLAAFPVVRLGQERPADAQVEARPDKAPRIDAATALEPQPADTIAAFEAEKRRRLAEYGWVDRAQGIARIPIEQAIARLAREAPGSR